MPSGAAFQTAGGTGAAGAFANMAARGAVGAWVADTTKCRKLCVWHFAEAGCGLWQQLWAAPAEIMSGQERQLPHNRAATARATISALEIRCNKPHFIPG